MSAFGVSVLPAISKSKGPPDSAPTWIGGLYSVVRIVLSSTLAISDPLLVLLLTSIWPPASVSPWIRIAWFAPVRAERARMFRPAAKIGWKPGAASRSSDFAKLMSSSIGPLVTMSTPSPGAAASIQAWSVPLHGGDASGHV
jgi:hypothetical protein